jgi:hypothetical protein
MARVGSKKWQKMRPVMLRFFTVSDNGWTQKRLLKEHDRVSKSYSQKVEAGRSSALKRKETPPTDVATDEQRTFQQPEPEPEPEPYTSTNVDGANAPQDSDSVKTGKTDKDRIFALVSQLVVMTGDRESAVRSRIGLLRKSNEDAAILAALVAGIEGGVAHPLDYATRILSDEKTKSDYGNPEYWEKHFANQ